MDINHIIGYGGAVIIGFTLGLFGGGGALLATPILVYLFNIDITTATGYSLFLVGAAALVGAIHNVRKGQVNIKTTLYYGIPSLSAVFITRRFIVPAIPTHLFSIGGFNVTKDYLILIALLIAMLLAAYKMIAPDNSNPDEDKSPVNYTALIFYATFIGLFLGLIGTGGGFLIVPALLHFAKLDVKKAVGTALVLVCVNSFIGFTGDLRANNHIDWSFLLFFSGVAVAGVIAGSYTANYLHPKHMKKYLGWFIVVVGIWIVYKEYKKYTAPAKQANLSVPAYQEKNPLPYSSYQ